MARSSRADAGAPALSVVAVYSPAEFARLMREGIPKDGRKLELMAVTARTRFSKFSDEEVAGLYSYLSRQVAAATSEGVTHRRAPSWGQSSAQSTFV